MFIGAGPSQMAGILTAKQMGCNVVALDGNPSAPGLQIADTGVVTDVKNSTEAISLAKQFRIDYAMTVASDICLKTVADVNDALNLPGLTPNEIRYVINKSAMRTQLAKKDVPSPAFFIINDASQVLEACAEIGFPLVMKPVDNAGSRGVFYIEDASQAVEMYPQTRKESLSGEVILEEFMPGEEVSVEAFVVNGSIHILTLSDKIRTSPPFLLDERLSFPSVVEGQTKKNTINLAIEAIKGVGINNCPVHMEIILTKEGPKLVEMAARGPGFKVYTDIIPHVTGIDCVKMELDILLGNPVNIQPVHPLKGACLLFFGSDRDGIVKEITYRCSQDEMAQIYEVSIYVKPGEAVKNLSCGADRMGHLITLESTREKAESLALKIFNQIEINVLPPANS